MQTKLKILSLQWQRKWLKPSPWHLQPNVLSAVYARRVQPVICQVLFYILYKESASPRFPTLLQSECLLARRRRARRLGLQSSPLASTFCRREETFLQIVYHVLYVVIHMCVLSSWNIAGVWVLTAVIRDIAAARCPLASSWQTRRECMPIADRAGLNWWPHPTPLPVYLCRGRASCRAGRVFSKLKQAQVCMLGYEKRTAEACVTSHRRSFRPPVLCFTKMFCPPPSPRLRLPAPTSFFFPLSFLNCHHCFYSSWEHLALVFLCLLHILRREFLESVFVCVEPLRRWKLARTGWLSKRSQTPSQCFWVSDFRPSPSPSPSFSRSLSPLCLSICGPAWDCFVRPLCVSSLTLPPRRLGSDGELLHD